MKFNLNPRELLAVHNLLQRHLTNNDRSTNDDVQLDQVYNRLRACLLSALSDDAKVDRMSLDDKLSLWLKQQRTKVDSLTTSVTRSDHVHSQPDKQQTSDILVDDDDEVLSEIAYPSGRSKGRQPPPPNMPHHKKRRGHKK